MFKSTFIVLAIIVCNVCFASPFRSGKSEFKVIGYISSNTQIKPRDIRYNQITHLNYAFAFPESSGEIKTVPKPGLLKEIVGFAHKNGVKVLLSVGGWHGGDDSAFEMLASNRNSRKLFAARVLSILEEYHLDGADIDWEYPDKGASAQNFLLLIKDLFSALKGRDYLLTAAAVSRGDRIGLGVLPETFSYLDFVNIMAYDNSKEQHHSTYDHAKKSLLYWHNRGLPRNKMNLGVPFYAKPGWVRYSSIVGRDSSASRRDRTGNLYYNGMESIAKKTRLALDLAGGIMVWELSYDDRAKHSLLNVIDKVITTNEID